MSNTSNDQDQDMQLVTFAVGDTVLGVSIEHVQEINRSLDVTRVPGAAHKFHGVINLRGDVVTVLDPHYIFGLESEQELNRRRNLILNIAEERIGIVVDRVIDIIDIQRSDLTKRPSNVNSIDRKYIDSVYLRNGQIVVVLDAISLTALADEMVESAAA